MGVELDDALQGQRGALTVGKRHGARPPGPPHGLQPHQVWGAANPEQSLVRQPAPTCLDFHNTQRWRPCPTDSLYLCWAQDFPCR